MKTNRKIKFFQTGLYTQLLFSAFSFFKESEEMLYKDRSNGLDLTVKLCGFEGDFPLLFEESLEMVNFLPDRAPSLGTLLVSQFCSKISVANLERNVYERIP